MTAPVGERPESWIEMGQRLLTVDETATILRISRAKMYAMVASGEFPTIRMGRSVRVRPDKLLAWLDARS